MNQEGKESEKVESVSTDDIVELAKKLDNRQYHFKFEFEFGPRLYKLERRGMRASEKIYKRFLDFVESAMSAALRKEGIEVGKEPVKSEEKTLSQSTDAAMSQSPYACAPQFETCQVVTPRGKCGKPVAPGAKAFCHDCLVSTGQD